MISKVPSHAAEAVALLPQRFKDAPAMVALVSALAASFDSGEQDLIDMLTKRVVVAVTEGVQLDALAATFGVFRQGRSDVDLRAAILTEVQVQLSSGTIDDLYLLTGGQVLIDDNRAAQTAEFSARVCSAFDGDPDQTFADALARSIGGLLNRGRAAGVYFTLEWISAESIASVGGSNWFVFDFSPMDTATQILASPALSATDNPE